MLNSMPRPVVEDITLHKVASNPPSPGATSAEHCNAVTLPPSTCQSPRVPCSSTMASLAVSRRVDDLHIGLNNFIALETSPSRVSNGRTLEKHVKREVTVQYQSTSRQESRQFIGNEPPRQDASTYRIFPKQGAKTPFRPNSPAVGVFERKPVPGLSNSLESQEAWNNALSSKTAQSSNRRDVPSPRRKEEVSDIMVDMMTTVQEYAMDSRKYPSLFSFEYR